MIFYLMLEVYFVKPEKVFSFRDWILEALSQSRFLPMSVIEICLRVPCLPFSIWQCLFSEVISLFLLATKWFLRSFFFFPSVEGHPNNLLLF